MEEGATRVVGETNRTHILMVVSFFLGLSKPPLHHCHSFLSTTTVSSKQQHSAAANFFFLLGAKRGKGGCDHCLRVCLHPASCAYPSELRASLVLGHQVVLPIRGGTCHISGSLHLSFLQKHAWTRSESDLCPVESE